MTPGNVKRLKEIHDSLDALLAEQRDAQFAVLVLLQIQARISTVMTDLILRPEVNS